ncbi:putative molybdenum carrier protein [Desulfosudis oleivorans]|uniref:Molybdenum cofactor carrier n=1 Tax=Desulfosudis oleivorans (strain DSM 6200 / JCM 39069 / Hxd3) TaxID=96561 RepID=A8ZXE5_DESOH|nr:putative molybdenum carrier protein [Desulfosudis oleivorans]ABW68524.1 conserved hypothetical protein [Desulfosudis oleivorans Hxd3]
MNMMRMASLKKIISGGQTGADRAGLDAAMDAGIEYGGWLPKGRKAEDGIVPARYTKLQELSRGGYPKRTEQNVIDSDGTIIFTFGRLTGGSDLTRQLAEKHGRPWLHIDLTRIADPVTEIQDWLRTNKIKVLNIAGSRESKSPGIYRAVRF